MMEQPKLTFFVFTASKEACCNTTMSRFWFACSESVFGNFGSSRSSGMDAIFAVNVGT
jgi:hypothetical protein